MYRRATHAWEKANRALAEDWHYNLEFDRCEHGMRPAATHGGCLVPLHRAERCTLHAFPVADLPAVQRCECPRTSCSSQARPAGSSGRPYYGAVPPTIPTHRA